jgi:hypothetical protein
LGVRQTQGNNNSKGEAPRAHNVAPPSPAPSLPHGGFISHDQRHPALPIHHLVIRLLGLLPRLRPQRKQPIHVRLEWLRRARARSLPSQAQPKQCPDPRQNLRSSRGDARSQEGARAPPLQQRAPVSPAPAPSSSFGSRYRYHCRCRCRPCACLGGLAPEHPAARLEV